MSAVDGVDGPDTTDRPAVVTSFTLVAQSITLAEDGSPPSDSDPEVEADAGDGPGATSVLEGLVGAAVGDEPGARARLLAEIHPLVLRYCRGRLGRQETAIGSADDVAQDICLAVVSALPTYTIKGLSFRAFVYGIAAHKVTDAFRAIGRNRAEPVADVPDTAVSNDGPEHHMLAVELSEHLGGLLHKLTPRQREVLVLRLAVGMSAEETAQAVRSTPGAVRVTQHRALGRLRQIIAEFRAGPGSVQTAEADEGDDGDAFGMPESRVG